ncbi:hypothetical protein TIFTF001_006057 [Ficus carica]|uniref:F-box domain-containing protein n=1 Tax=Ficus carica TaxID=3494 RepID=A0AA88A9M2_FICCA|nr:hypothetical protein TIFTF001_006057 [Ficus carica]
MASLPWDITVNILCRLPVKDLLRYRSVSKPWRSLIDGPDFIKMHLNNSMEMSSNLGIVIRDCDLHWVDLGTLDSAVKLRHPIGKQGDGTEVLGSCHGLLVLLNIDDDVALWNPSTRRYRKLPVSDIEFPPGNFPIVQFIVYGFGYDPISDDYKLVRMVQFFGDDGEDSFDSEVKIYSAKSNTWKRISDFPHYLRYKRGFGKLANNALHWVVSRKPLSDVSKLVFALDLVTEEYWQVPLPDFRDENLHINVEALGGSLCLLCNYVSDDPDADWGSASDHVDMWIMREYGVKESWTKFCTVVPSYVIGSFSYVFPIAYLKNGNQVLMNKNGEKFIVYDLESEKAKSVSKRWLSLIDGPDFIKMHLNNSIETSSNLGVVISNLMLYWVDLDLLDSAVKLNHHPLRGDSDESEVVGSCHELLALWNSDCDAAIWNPSTRSYDYKLVRIVLFFGDEGEDSFESEVKIYSAKSNAWKRISDLPYYLRFSCVHGAYTNNALHWVVSRKPMSDPSNFVLALDLMTEEYREVLLPDCKDAVDFMNVEVLGGSLSLLCNYGVDNPELDWQAASDHFDLWVMKEYGSGSQVLMNKNALLDLMMMVDLLVGSEEIKIASRDDFPLSRIQTGVIGKLKKVYITLEVDSGKGLARTYPK